VLLVESLQQDAPIESHTVCGTLTPLNQVPAAGWCECSALVQSTGAI